MSEIQRWPSHTYTKIKGSILVSNEVPRTATKKALITPSSAQLYSATLAQQRSGSFRTHQVYVYRVYEVHRIPQQERKAHPAQLISRSSAAPCGPVPCCAFSIVHIKEYAHTYHTCMRRRGSFPGAWGSWHYSKTPVAPTVVHY